MGGVSSSAFSEINKAKSTRDRETNDRSCRVGGSRIPTQSERLIRSSVQISERRQGDARAFGAVEKGLTLIVGALFGGYESLSGKWKEPESPGRDPQGLVLG